MNIPCPIHVNCPPVLSNLEYDSPLANFSSEAPDQDLFIGVNTGWDLNLPPIGSTWDAVGCLSICESAISQQDADLCAARQELSCTINGGQTGSNGPFVKPWLLPNGNPVPLFPNLSQSCSFTCPDGLLFTWTVAPGQVLDPNPIAANEIAFSIACRQANLHYMCLSSIPSGCANVIYKATITVATGIGVLLPLGFTVTVGSLPNGLFLSQNQTTAFISGTPTTPGNYQFTLRVTDANGNFMEKVYTLAILGISNINSLPNPMAGHSYSAMLTGAGGTAPYKFGTITGLPVGMTLGTDGTLSGIPSVHYSDGFSVIFQVTDVNNNTCNATWNSTVLEPPGPDWTKLSWSAYQLNQGSALNTISGSAAGPIASGSLTCNTGAANVSISPANASGVTYTGAQVTANIQLIVSDWNNAADLMTVRVIHSVAGIIGGLGAINGPGTYNFNFTVPASVGASITVDGGTQLALVQANQFVGSPIKLTFVFTIFNL